MSLTPQPADGGEPASEPNAPTAAPDGAAPTARGAMRPIINEPDLTVFVMAEVLVSVPTTARPA
ncbi:MAG TPA: hypothetical protein VGT98_10980 [Candidatus Elarobacter sp.]|nr:hypothetical protein [Candidatus Elarobacter sp.]